MYVIEPVKPDIHNSGLQNSSIKHQGVGITKHKCTHEIQYVE